MQFKTEVSMDPAHIQYILSKLQVTSASSLPPPPSTPRRSKRLERATTGGVACREGVEPVAMSWLECMLMHVSSLGMPVYVQYQFLQVLSGVDHLVSQTAQTVTNSTVS